MLIFIKSFYNEIIASFFLHVYLFVCNSTKNRKTFNGKDLIGRTIHGTEKWNAQNGELICESGPDKQ